MVSALDVVPGDLGAGAFEVLRGGASAGLLDLLVVPAVDDEGGSTGDPGGIERVLVHQVRGEGGDAGRGERHRRVEGGRQRERTTLGEPAEHEAALVEAGVAEQRGHRGIDGAHAGGDLVEARAIVVDPVPTGGAVLEFEPGHGRGHQPLGLGIDHDEAGEEALGPVAVARQEEEDLLGRIVAVGDDLEGLDAHAPIITGSGEFRDERVSGGVRRRDRRPSTSGCCRSARDFRRSERGSSCRGPRRARRDRGHRRRSPS